MLNISQSQASFLLKDFRQKLLFTLVRDALGVDSTHAIRQRFLMCTVYAILFRIAWWGYQEARADIFFQYKRHRTSRSMHSPDSRVHGANIGPTCVLSAPDGPLVGPTNLAIWVGSLFCVLCEFYRSIPLFSKIDSLALEQSCGKKARTHESNNIKQYVHNKLKKKKLYALLMGHTVYEDQ